MSFMVCGSEMAYRIKNKGFHCLIQQLFVRIFSNFVIKLYIHHTKQ